MSSLEEHKHRRWRDVHTSHGWSRSAGGRGLPGDEERGVVVGGMAVVLDVSALLPDAEVVESGGGVEAHRRALLFTHIRGA